MHSESLTSLIIYMTFEIIGSLEPFRPFEQVTHGHTFEAGESVESLEPICNCFEVAGPFAGLMLCYLHELRI